MSSFPVTELLPALREALAQGRDVVLEAAPGAGKTTVVPLALLPQAWLAGQIILLVQPRRVAARAAAARMAELLGEAVGQTIGYRIRLDSCVSDSTRVEVITEGILARRLQRDPGLNGVGLVVFDEFHERNLDSELGLALVLQGRELFREGPPLRLLVMSATLEAVPVAALLEHPAVLHSTGRQFPVTIEYGRAPGRNEPLAGAVARTVQLALRHQAGSVLVFLPGQAEINRVAGRLAEESQRDVMVAPLHGGLSLARQQQAIAPCPQGRRKVVLATNIAETSLTIEGISTVVDCGLERQPVFDTATGTTHLLTRRISRASAAQRAGRAGRLGPGHCYRLWSEEQQGRLPAQRQPELQQSDLAPLVLQLLAWGVQDPAELRWMEPPPAANYQQALAVLALCGAAFARDTATWQLTPHGVTLAQLPLHPRLGHMLLTGAQWGVLDTAALLAAALVERNPLAGREADLAATLAVLNGERPCPREFQPWLRRCRQQAAQYRRMIKGLTTARAGTVPPALEDAPGLLVAVAWPDRIARRRAGGDPGQYQLANGRSATLSVTDALCAQTWLATADVAGSRDAATDRIYSATALNPACFSDLLASLVSNEETAEWDTRSEQFSARSRRLVGRLELDSVPLEPVPEEALQRALAELLRRRGLQLLPWTPELQQWRARVALLRRLDLAAGQADSPWPDLGDEALLDQLEQWLLPWLGPVRKLQDFARLDLKGILLALLPWPLPADLERLAPERLAVPSGSSIRIDYLPPTPVLAVKLQEMFGCVRTPTVAAGRQSLQLQLLSPARRPLQVTQDLSSFWRDVYPQVRKEMKGRYPKHPWPEDPLQALPTAHTNRRLQQPR
ncbi:ATP-dependent helicase HrpB [Kineobactrum salinum]|uniref:ATP-dependent helicase HrpB n=1 Tax=Kineobactrum salinum TaxID=2708301 RepID=A0A6C0U6J7_9GAMM|nr:ATP-dependent helicase HrpB [Kineobactrum salinum]